jgi:hypothetical protein
LDHPYQCLRLVHLFHWSAETAMGVKGPVLSLVFEECVESLALILRPCVVRLWEMLLAVLVVRGNMYTWVEPFLAFPWRLQC